jgi:hypothetical protein
MFLKLKNEIARMTKIVGHLKGPSTFSTMILSTTSLSIMTLSIMILSIKTISII